MLDISLPDREARRGLQRIAGCENPHRSLDVVFVHGLGGDSWTTWMSDKEDMGTFWPGWLSEEFPETGIWMLGYAAESSQWKEASMPLADRSNQVLDLLEIEGLGQRPLMFITHSMGGIVVKQLLRNADSFGVERFESIRNQTRGIAFISTPHSGANIANFAALAAAVYRTNEHVEELGSHDSRLRELHGWFLNKYLHTHATLCRTYCEKREVRARIPLLDIELSKGILVVNETSAEPNIPGERAIPLDEDHISICKPKSRKDQIYKGMLAFVRECLQKPAASLIGPSQTAYVPSSVKQADSQLRHAADRLVGRKDELACLDQAWADPAKHVIVIRGIGGEGKTSLVIHWLDKLRQRNFDGANCFEWSFYTQGTSDHAGASSEPFIEAALSRFGGEPGRALAQSAASGRVKAHHLLEYLRAKRVLLVLDGLEPLQHPPGPLAGCLRDEAMADLLKGLAQHNPGLCVLTTRVRVRDLVRYEETTAPEWELTNLSDQDGANLLYRLLEPQKPRGVHQVSSTVREREEISQAVKGHALTLRLLGGYIHRALRDVRRWRELDYSRADAQYVTNPKATGDAPERYGHAFTTMAAYEHWLASGGPAGQRQLAVLRLLGLFDRPASASLLTALRASPPITHLTEPLQGMTPLEWRTTLSELEECGLVGSLPANDTGSIDAHPLLREYFAKQLQTLNPQAWRAAHRRIFEHLCATTKEGRQPSLERLQPLYQAVAHGCKAALYVEALNQVLRPRIQLKDAFYSTYRLGAIGSDLVAFAGFFDKDSSSVTNTLPPRDRAFVHRQTAYCLRSLGRSRDAVVHFRAALNDVHGEPGCENDTATIASLLCEALMQLGELNKAVDAAQTAVEAANSSGEGWRRTVCYTQLGAALLQMQRTDECKSAFDQAESIHRGQLAATPSLILGNNYRYCDWLLARGGKSHEVLKRLEDACVVEENHDHWGPFSEAYRCVIRGRAFAQRNGTGDVARAEEDFRKALDLSKKAGRDDFAVQAYLELARVVVSLGVAEEYLDLAWEIAKPSSMNVALADIHLNRARLFMHAVDYPWHENEDGTPRDPVDDLREARRLINEHGYDRRLEELQDAEEALKQCVAPISGDSI